MHKLLNMFQANLLHILLLLFLPVPRRLRRALLQGCKGKEIIESVRNLPYVEDVTEMLEINHMDFNDIIFKPREFDRKNQSTRHKRFLWKSEAEYIEGFLGKNE